MNKFGKKGKDVPVTNSHNEVDSENFFPSKEDRMNLKEVAELFGTTPQTVINWKKRNIIPYYQIHKSSRPFYSRSQLIKLASQNQDLTRMKEQESIEKIKNLIIHKGITQAKVAERCNIHTSTLNKWLNGKGNNQLHMSKIERIIQYLEAVNTNDV